MKSIGQILVSLLFALSFLLPVVQVSAFDPDEEWNQLIDKNPWIDVAVKLMLVILLYMVLRIIWRQATKAFKDEIPPGSFSTLKTTGNVVIFLIALIALASLFQSSELATALIGVSALIGTAIGFASTHTLGNLMSGLYLIVTKPFRVGDYVILPQENTEGIVQELGINYTEILTIQGNNIVIANRRIMGTRIINLRIEEEDILAGYTAPPDDQRGLSSEPTEKGSSRAASGAFRSLRAKLKQRDEYLYPFVYSIGPGPDHLVLKSVLDEVCEQFDDQTTEPMSWFVLDRNRLEVKYQLNVVVEDPYDFLSLIPAIRLAIEDDLQKKLAT
ncbi:MAG: mechanosensitive ion channel domain-containing protein [Candidatus Heimdallarchaeota archaeon]